MPSLDEVLQTTTSWPAEPVAAAITDTDTTLASIGPGDEVLAFASVTKPLAAYAVLIAVQDGALHLDEPVAIDDAPDGITVRHLLAHTSGLPLDRGGLIGAPGRKRIYSNWAFEVLGELVEERTGMPFAEHLHDEVLAPLRMTATVLEGSPAHAGRGTVDDLVRFVRELLRPTLVDDELLATATEVAFEGLDGVVPGFGRQSPCDWGLGLEIKGDKDPHWTGAALPPSTFGHFGRSGSFFWVDRSRGIGAATLAGREFDTWAKEAWPPFNDALVAAVDAP
jgi:CubicO group peptidase (beta-lactamase class C family)